MAEQIKATGKPSSDKLAIALACLAGVMAIILSLAEKTPGTIGILLMVMVLLCAYPIFHFARSSVSRIGLVLCVAVGAGLFGWRIWPSTTSVSAAQQKPTVEQNSNGNNSPNINIPGNHNNVTVIYGNDPRLKEQRDRIEKLLKGKRDQLTPEKLLKTFNLGYTIFAADYSNTVIPYQVRGPLSKWQIDWSAARYLKNGPKTFELQLPTLSNKSQNAYFHDNRFFGSKMAGPPFYIYWFHGVLMQLQILNVNDKGMILLVGLRSGAANHLTWRFDARTGTWGFYPATGTKRK